MLGEDKNPVIASDLTRSRVSIGEDKNPVIASACEAIQGVASRSDTDDEVIASACEAIQTLSVA